MDGLQDRYAPEARCFGCGPMNAKGLRIKSYPGGAEHELVASFSPKPWHQAFDGVLSGGIAGTLLDCHSNWAAAMFFMGKRKATAPPPTVTAEYSVRLKRPTPTTGLLTLRAKVIEGTDDRAIVEASIESGGVVTAACTGTFVAVGEDHPAYHRW